MLSVVNDAAVALLLSIGHQTGLFDRMAGLPPSTSAEIAAAAGLNERYVREWLGGMVCASIVDYDSNSHTYHLPAHHVPALTRAGGPDNVAKMAQYVALLGEVEQRIVDCFRDGGGLPYSAFPRFHGLRAEESGAVFDAALIGTTLPLVNGLTERLQAGIEVADFGCGSGHAINVMAQAFPASTFTGYDFSEQAMSTARKEAAELGLSNTRFVAQDLAAIPKGDAFDAVVVFDAIHDQVHPDKVLANIYRALRTGGDLLMVDIKASSDLAQNRQLPWATWLYTISTMHCMTVSLSAGGAGLGTMWGHELATSMLADAGFTDVHIAEVDTDPFNNYYIAHK
ncbi:class I SAM-dependent methyltransferase [Mycobacterium sp. NPDC048908]|uniref:class I SAM-dependent methyltransferase n=1 Tax=Mycobacterium sp. NPDC048908 TaxID=3364292 RepID=UPI0037180C7B